MTCAPVFSGGGTIGVWVLMAVLRPARFLFLILLLASAAGPLAAEPAEAVRIIELEIASRMVRGPEVMPGRPAGVIRLKRGETVELRWRSDEPATLHLHGYNIETQVAAGSTSSMRFVARATGRFAIETHGIGANKHLERTLLYLEVHPR
jgi:FtsP/CotA-like multicopper oxidase with cupredoxin domain